MQSRMMETLLNVCQDKIEITDKTLKAAVSNEKRTVVQIVSTCLFERLEADLRPRVTQELLESAVTNCYS
jgi:hypothetical protein